MLFIWPGDVVAFACSDAPFAHYISIDLSLSTSSAVNLELLSLAFSRPRSKSWPYSQQPFFVIAWCSVALSGDSMPMKVHCSMFFVHAYSYPWYTTFLTSPHIFLHAVYVVSFSTYLSILGNSSLLFLIVAVAVRFLLTGVFFGMFYCPIIRDSRNKKL